MCRSAIYSKSQHNKKQLLINTDVKESKEKNMLSNRRKIAKSYGIRINLDGSGLPEYDNFYYEGIRLDLEEFTPIGIAKALFEAGRKKTSEDIKKALQITSPQPHYDDYI